ncbi:MAG: hypothetical protein K6T73_01330 [Candidatus Bathyarchaeota archaeon]|nr:hypothetical protein [Candidatus Bathyarchaeota archaeon]
MYKLVCRQDPVALGIENKEGDWDMVKFEAHINKCRACKDTVTYLKSVITHYLHGIELLKSQNQGDEDDFEVIPEGVIYYPAGYMPGPFLPFGRWFLPPEGLSLERVKKTLRGMGFQIETRLLGVRRLEVWKLHKGE